MMSDTLIVLYMAGAVLMLGYSTRRVLLSDELFHRNANNPLYLGTICLLLGLFWPLVIVVCVTDVILRRIKCKES